MNNLEIEVYTRSADAAFSEDFVARGSIPIGILPASRTFKSARHTGAIQEVRIDIGPVGISFSLLNLVIKDEEGVLIAAITSNARILDNHEGIIIDYDNNEIAINCIHDDSNIIIPVNCETNAVFVTISISVYSNKTTDNSEKQLEVLAELQKELATAVRQSSQIVQRMMDSVMIEQEAVRRSLQDSRNISANIKTLLDDNLPERSVTAQVLTSLDESLNKLRDGLVERDERQRSRNDTVEGTLLGRFDHFESKVLNEVMDTRAAVQSTELTVLASTRDLMANLQSSVHNIQGAIGGVADLVDRVYRDQTVLDDRLVDQHLRDASMRTDVFHRFDALQASVQDIASDAGASPHITRLSDQASRQHHEAMETLALTRNGLMHLGNRIADAVEDTAQTIPDKLDQISREILSQIAEYNRQTAQLSNNSQIVSDELADQYRYILSTIYENNHINQTLESSNRAIVNTIDQNNRRLLTALASHGETAQEYDALNTQRYKSAQDDLSSTRSALASMLNSVATTVEAQSNSMPTTLAAMERRIIQALDSQSVADRKSTELRNEIDRLKNALGCMHLSTEATIQEAAKVRAERDHYRSLTQHMIRSLSWTLTRPIRILKRLLATGRLRAT